MVEPGEVPAATGEWECMECGYVEESTQTRRPKLCPDCGAPASAFEFFAFDEDDEEEWDAEPDEDDEDEDDFGTEDGEEDEDEEDVY